MILFGLGGVGAILWDQQVGVAVPSTVIAPLSSGTPKRRTALVGAPAQLATEGVFATYGADHVVALDDETAPVTVDDLSLPGGPVTTQAITGGTSTPDPSTMAIAANAQGEVAAILESCSGCAAPVPVLLVRAAGATAFGSPQPLMPALPANDQAGVGAVSVAVDSNGNVLAAWTGWTGKAPSFAANISDDAWDVKRAGTASASRWGTYARMLLAGGTLTPAIRLGPANDKTVLATALDATGRPAVAWETATLSDNVAGDTAITAWAAAGDTGGQFTPGQLLQSFSAAEVANFVGGLGGTIALVENPEPLVLWTGLANHRLAVRAATLAGSHFGETRTLSMPSHDDNLLAGLQPSKTGGATALWMSFAPGKRGPEREKTRLMSSTASQGDAFAAPQTVSTTGPVLFSAALAIDPVTGHAVAAWVAAPRHYPQALYYSVRR